MKFCVVFSVLPSAEEPYPLDEEWMFVDCNIPRRLRKSRARRGYEGWDARGSWAWESFGGDLPGSLWDERDVPADLRAGGKFVALVEGRTYKCGHPLDPPEWDAEVEVLSYRRVA